MIRVEIVAMDGGHGSGDGDDCTTRVDSVTNPILEEIIAWENEEKTPPEETVTQVESNKKNETARPKFRSWYMPVWLGDLSWMDQPKYHLGPTMSTSSIKDRIDFVRDLFGNKQSSNLELKEDDIDNCLKEMWTLLNRNWFPYSVTNALKDDKLLSLLFYDGCFIISKLLNLWNGDFGFEVSPNPTVSQLKEDLDTILWFENQIPLHVLRTILKFVDYDKKGPDSKAIRYHFSNHWQFILEQLFLAPDSKVEMFHCLLHMHHYSFCRNYGKKLEGQIQIRCGCNFFPERNNSFIGKPVRDAIPSATTLFKGGVRFKKIDTFTQISFRHGKLSIPSVKIVDRETLDLLALECCQETIINHENPISTVLYFIALMVKLPEDLELLENCGIVKREAKFSNDAIFHFFDDARKEIYMNFEGSNISHVCKEIDLFLNSRTIQWWVNLKRNYFGNPWTVISLFAATFLLIMTCIQTFFTVYPYYYPSSH